jgi:hypothetical protein
MSGGNSSPQPLAIQNLFLKLETGARLLGQGISPSQDSFLQNKNEHNHAVIGFKPTSPAVKDSMHLRRYSKCDKHCHTVNQIHFNIILPSIPRSLPIPLKDSNRNSPRQNYLTPAPTPTYSNTNTHMKSVYHSYLSAQLSDCWACPFQILNRFNTSSVPTSSLHSSD